MLRTVKKLAVTLVLAAAVILPGCIDDDIPTITPDPPSSLRTIEKIDYIRDCHYLDGKIFDLGQESDFDPLDTIKAIEVYKYFEANQGASIGDTAIMLVDPDNPESFPDEASIAMVEAINPDVYYFNPSRHFIMFETPNAGLNNGEIGVWMVVKRAGGGLDTIGNITGSPDTLKLLKHRDPDSTMVTWEYAWRNVYYLGGKDIIPEDLTLNVLMGPVGTEGLEANPDQQDGVPYIQILGLDRHKTDGRPGPDGVADLHIASVFMVGEGTLVFPDRKPFNTSNTFGTVELAAKVPKIYTCPRGSIEAYEASRYYIEVKRSIVIDLDRITGDVNLNGIPYEIADAELFSRYFTEGTSVFTIDIEAQSRATEVNGDGVELKIADLVYLIRFITGDALPQPSTNPWSFADFTVSGGTVRVETNVDLGAIQFVFDSPITPTLDQSAAHMDLTYTSDDSHTRVLVYSFDQNAIIETGNVLNFTGQANLNGVAAAEYRGANVARCGVANQ